MVPDVCSEAMIDAYAGSILFSRPLNAFRNTATQQLSFNRLLICLSVSLLGQGIPAFVVEFSVGLARPICQNLHVRSIVPESFSSLLELDERLPLFNR